MQTATTSSLTADDIEILPATTRAEMERFIRLPERLQANDKNFIPPLRFERRMAFSPKFNPLFEFTDAGFWLARRNGIDVGRISAQIERRAIEIHKDDTGYFGCIAAEDDPLVFQALTSTAESWLRARNMRRVHGPFNLSINEELGLLVDGFDTPPMLLMGHDLPYVGKRLEEQGYKREKDVLAYLYDTEQDMPVAVRRLIDRPLPANVTLRHVDLKRLRAEVDAITNIFNDAWSGNWGFVPLSEAETDHLAKSLRPLLHEKLVWFVDVDGEPAGFIVCLPNMNDAIADLQGKLFPFGWARFLWRLKVRGVTTARVPLMGVKRKFSSGLLGTLLPFLIIDAVRREAAKLGYRQIELSWILEDNLPMRRINEALEGKPYKTYRIYDKPLT